MKNISTRTCNFSQYIVTSACILLLLDGVTSLSQRAIGAVCYNADGTCQKSCVPVARDYEYRLKADGLDIRLQSDPDAFGQPGSGYYGEYYKWISDSDCTEYKNDVCEKVAEKNCRPYNGER